MFKCLFILIVCNLACAPAWAQLVETEWVSRTSPGADWNRPTDIAIDDSGCIYVTGSCEGAGGTPHDFATVKLGADGEVHWVRTYDGELGLDDFASGVEVDGDGCVYVAGAVDGYLKIGQAYDYCLIKYFPAGDTAWIRQYDGPQGGSDWAYDMALTADGNVILTGESERDYATVKYHAYGVLAWERRYDGPGQFTDQATALALDSNDNVYVTGNSTGRTAGFGYATIKYYADGQLAWVRRYDEPDAALQEVAGLAVDAAGNVGVTGESDGSFVTLMYDTDGNLLWLRRYAGPGRALPHDLTFDNSGALLITGQQARDDSQPENYDLTVLKYSGTGEELWARTYAGPADGQDVGWAVTTDHDNNIYITGQSDRTTTYPFNSDVLTIKYNPTGVRCWVVTYNGSGDGWDQGDAVISGGAGPLYVAASSAGAGNYSDFVTIKYCEYPCLCGDADGRGSWSISDVVFLIAFIFGGGPAPDPACLGDADGNCLITISDATYLLAYIFGSGPEPKCAGSPCEWE